jgi:hypothetical protein
VRKGFSFAVRRAYDKPLERSVLMEGALDFKNFDEMDLAELLEAEELQELMVLNMSDDVSEEARQAEEARLEEIRRRLTAWLGY